VQDTLPAQIENIDLLSHLSREKLNLVAQSCMWRRFKRGEQILSRDSESRDLFFVASGKVEVANFSSNGREIAYATIDSGGFFGELSAIDDRPRSASVTASDDCVVAIMPRTAFIDLIRDDPDISLTVMNRLANIIRACDERIMDLSTLGAVQRVYVEVLRLCGPDPAVPNLWSVYPMPTQADIAARASTTRETVARVLGQLTQAGLVQRKGRTLYINDRETLKAMSENAETRAERAAEPVS
jgi:CRP-like cAMP-binding protein